MKNIIKYITSIFSVLLLNLFFLQKINTIDETNSMLISHNKDITSIVVHNQHFSFNNLKQFLQEAESGMHTNIHPSKRVSEKEKSCFIDENKLWARVIDNNLIEFSNRKRLITITSRKNTINFNINYDLKNMSKTNILNPVELDDIKKLYTIYSIYSFLKGSATTLKEETNGFLIKKLSEDIENVSTKFTKLFNLKKC